MSFTKHTVYKIGIQLNQRDWDNQEALSAGISGCDKLFLCLLPNWDEPSCERRQCQNILNIAHAMGVKQVVASTTLGVSQLDDNVRIAPGSFMEKHMINKKSLEQAVEDMEFEFFTFLRPTFFMANFLEPKVNRYAEIRDQRNWTTSMTAETQLPIVDHVDIAKFAAATFQNPDRFHRRSIGIASDQMSFQEILDLLAGAAGLLPGSIRARSMADEEIEVQTNMSGFSNSHKALRTASHYVNMDELRNMVALTSFREFLEREQAAVKQTYTA
ncbi:hypothetical protein LQW54_010547 [Pestalotiopsis sp. IQ-011]